MRRIELLSKLDEVELCINVIKLMHGSKVNYFTYQELHDVIKEQLNLECDLDTIKILHETKIKNYEQQHD